MNKSRMHKIILTVTLLGSLSVATAHSWLPGKWTCNLDGRTTQMKWEYAPMGAGGCDANGTCWTAEDANYTYQGAFQDVGRPWVRLERMNDRPYVGAAFSPISRGNTLYFYYSGDGTTWKLVYDPRTRTATGNSTWRGKAYPLSCRKTNPG